MLRNILSENHRRLVIRAMKHRFINDRFEIKYVLSHLSEGDVAVDIGAYKGAYTYWMSRIVGSTGKVYAFEPQPQQSSYLKSVFALPGYGMVNIESMALSSSPGEATLVIPEKDRNYSQLARLEFGSTDGMYSYKVRVDALDNYLSPREDRPVKFIKCDVEGHELEVFRGAENILSKDRPMILFECEARHHAGDTMNSVFNYLKDLGYDGRFFMKGQLLPLSEFDTAKYQGEKAEHFANNFIFKHT